MEVQAQYPSTAAPFNSNYPPRRVPRLAGVDAAPFVHINDAVAQLTSNPPGTFVQQHQAYADGAALLSGEPVSELTCNVSGSRKRPFLGCGVAHTKPQMNSQLHVHGEMAPLVKAAATAPGTCAEAASSVQASNNRIRLDDSAVASTSGRSPAVAPVVAPAISPLTKELAPQLYQQNLDVDSFIRLQNERIRSGLENARTRHNRALLSAIEQGVLRRLREKEAELDSATRHNTELEEKIRQLVSENQVWFNMARNNEATVSGLRATIEQVLLQNGAAALGAPTDHSEGCGESDCPPPGLPAEDAQSCCYEGMPAAAGDAKRVTAAAGENSRGLRVQNVCRVCRKREVMVLILPCRHLCLCRRCEPGLDACPVCNATKNSSLQVFMC
ncbi:hypothetical protein Taro_038219 [Colocasia esculenta]|uniref:RING-type domain-containing protein n=1 Tax=Colocasia esculenta TaxID=4460 RepID=A0A843W7L6_COLES|nr:hypothetical protein [Colocasia esculenta]